MSDAQDKQRLWSPLVRALVPYTPGEQPKIDNLLKLNTNESPFAPSPKVAEAIVAELRDGAKSLRLYPDPDASFLKTVIADYHQLPANHVFLGNGSDEVLAHVFMAFFKQDQPILYPDITYSFYPVYRQLYEVNARTIALSDDFTIAIEDYRVANGGIIIANPNAPTGILLSLAQIQTLLQHNTNSIVVIDEAYIDFGGQSAIALIQQFDNLVVTQTVSKSRALAGLRVGIAFAQPHLIEALERVKNSFNSYPLDRLAIVGCAASYQDDAYFQQTCQTLIANRDHLVVAMQALGFDVLPSHANFIFARHRTHAATKIAAHLREAGIIVRHFNSSRIDNFLRITVGTAEQHERLLARLALLST